jgi:hypothetical protein
LKRLFLILVVLFVAESSFGQWVTMNGPNGAQMKCILSVPGKVYVGTANNKFNYTTDDGLTWINSGAGLIDNGVYALTVFGNSVVIGTNSGIFYNDLNISSAWTPTNNGLTNFSISAFTVIGTKLLAGTYGGGVFISNGPATDWVQSNLGLANQTVIGLLTKGTDVYAGTYGGGVFKSTNQGNSWTAVNNGLINQYVPSFTTLGNTIFCGTYGAGVFRSTDEGATWEQVNNGLTNTTINGLVGTGNKLIAATQSGVFATFNNGGTWVQFNTGLSNQFITTIGLGTGKVYAGTDFAGGWKRNLTEIVSVENNITAVRKSFELKQNYPNPFNPTTNINFSLSKDSYLKLSLYDAAGKLLKILEEGNFKAGEYSEKINMDNFGTGVYFCSLETSEGIQTQKMILTK